MSSHLFYAGLLRPVVIYILRAAGFRAARSSVVDTLVDVTCRYIHLLASVTASQLTMHEHIPLQPQIEDVVFAMERCAVFKPQRHPVEALFRGREDLRGLDSFVDWVSGDVHHEIRRVAGMTRDPGPLRGLDVDDLSARENYLTHLKRRTGKNADRNRFQGTVLASSLPSSPRHSRIEGGPPSVQSWLRYRMPVQRRRSSNKAAAVVEEDGQAPATVDGG